MNKEMEGIVLSTRDYREHDAILSVLCKEEGLHRFVAMGLRKLSSKNAGSTQVYTHAMFYVDYHERKTMHALRTADIIENYRSIREDLLKQAIAAVLCECMENIAIEDPEAAFSLLKESLQHLQATKQPYALLALFMSIMNRLNGIEPYVDGCVHCGEENRIVGVSVDSGGFVCTNCFRNEKAKQYTRDDLKCFRLVCKAELAQFSILEAYQEWNFDQFMMVYSFFQEYSGINLKSIRFLTCLQDL